MYGRSAIELFVISDIHILHKDMYKWLYLGKTDKKPQKESNRSKYLDRVTDNSVQAREHPDAKFSIHINGQTKRNIKITIVLKTIPTT